MSASNSEGVHTEEIVAEGAPRPVGPYPHARRVGDWIFVSGIGPRLPGSDEIPGVTRDADGTIIDHDIDVQTRSALENIRVILESAGSSLEKIFDVTVFLTHIDRDFSRFNHAYAEYLGKVRPSRTTVGVTALPTPIAIEFKVIALA